MICKPQILLLKKVIHKLLLWQCLSMKLTRLWGGKKEHLILFFTFSASTHWHKKSYLLYLWFFHFKSARISYQFIATLYGWCCRRAITSLIPPQPHYADIFRGGSSVNHRGSTLFHREWFRLRGTWAQPPAQCGDSCVVRPACSGLHVGLVNLWVWRLHSLSPTSPIAFW